MTRKLIKLISHAQCHPYVTDINIYGTIKLCICAHVRPPPSWQMPLEISIFFKPSPSATFFTSGYFTAFPYLTLWWLLLIPCWAPIGTRREGSSWGWWWLLWLLWLLAIWLRFFFSVEDKLLIMTWCWSQTAPLFWWYWCFKEFLFMA